MENILVRIWDTAGTDQILKSEFKVLSGRMSVFVVVSDIFCCLIDFLFFLLVTTYRGTVKAKES